MGLREKKRLGDLLVEKGLISAEQLAAALIKQRASGEFLGLILVRSGWVSEEVLVKTLSDQFGIPFVRLADQQVEWNTAAQFPTSLLKERHCFPLRMDRQAITVAITNPLDAWAISELERGAGFRKVDLVLMSVKDVQDALGEFERRSRSR